MSDTRLAALKKKVGDRSYERTHMLLVGREGVKLQRKSTQRRREMNLRVSPTSRAEHPTLLRESTLAEQNLTVDPNDSFVFVKCIKITHRISAKALHSQISFTFRGLSPGYTRDWLPAYSFVLRARSMVLTGQRTLSDTSRARQ